MKVFSNRNILNIMQTPVEWHGKSWNLKFIVNREGILNTVHIKRH